MITQILYAGRWVLGIGAGWLGLSGLPFLKIGGLAALAILPALWMWWETSSHYADKINDVRLEERRAADERIQSMREALEEDSERKIAAAIDAETSVILARTPKEIRDACAREVSCREHNNAGQER